MTENNCELVFVRGDYNDDRVPDMADLLVLVDFITLGSYPPDGGAERADCNCDGVVNTSDIVYYMNYLFGTTDPPCY